MAQSVHDLDITLAVLLSRHPQRIGTQKKKLKMRTSADIVSRGIPYRRICGVYFLIHQGRIVYVGQSVDVMSRISSHEALGKVFDQYFFVRCHEEQLDEWERAYLDALLPELNKDRLTKRLRGQPSAAAA